MKLKKERTVHDGNLQANLLTYTLQNKVFASVLYNYFNDSQQNTIHQALSFNSKGFDVVGRNTSEGSADLIINP